MKRLVNISLLILFMSIINTEAFAYDAKIDGIYYIFYSEAIVVYEESEYVYGGSYSYINFH